MKKLLNHWIDNSCVSLHLGLTITFCAIYALGGLLGSSGVSENIVSALHTIGFTGLFAVILLVILHINIHGSNHFLKHFQDTSHLPSTQITRVGLFCALLLLIAASALMGGLAVLTGTLWTALKAWFASRPVSSDLEAAANIMPDADTESPDLSALAESMETPSWVEMLEQILNILGVVLIAALVIFVLARLILRLYRRFSQPIGWDDDVRISLKPHATDDTASEHPKPHSLSERLSRIFSRPKTPDEQIRRIYRQRIHAGLARTGAGRAPSPAPGSLIQPTEAPASSDQNNAKSDVSSAGLTASTPAELEDLAGLKDSQLHALYEKARYSAEPCLHDDVVMLKNHNI
ncbi:MAG: hypothetical protein LUD07_12815 [Clostridiales bacterium]|nr:hypothetical protein [Clostridiales bacterium]